MSTKWVAGAVVSLVMVALSLVLTLALLDSGPFGANTGKAVPAAVANDLSDGPSEGIKVHGDWVLEVRQPDGTLVQRQEFENDLTSGGANLLAEILARESNVHLWSILLFDAYGINSPWVDPAEGWIYEEAVPGQQIGTNVAYSLVLDTDDYGVLQLTGTITAEKDGSIAVVMTYIDWKLPSGGPSELVASGGMNFTTAYLDPPVNVLEGQQILVTVEISFS